MDPIAILSGLKDKVLDAKNFELLRNAYDLQNDNIEQLKSNNEAIKESNELLRERAKKLEKENQSLQRTVAELRQKVPQLDDSCESSGLSKVAVAILDLYHKSDETELWDQSQIIPPLQPSFTKIQVKSGLDELCEANIIRLSRGGGEDYLQYKLTVDGKKFLAEM